MPCLGVARSAKVGVVRSAMVVIVYLTHTTRGQHGSPYAAAIAYWAPLKKK